MRKRLAIAVWLAAAPAALHAEICVLETGGLLKIDARRKDGELLVLSLRGGGEVSLPPTAVRGFVPDEVVDEVERPGGDLRSLAREAALRHRVDPSLVLAVVAVESGFRPEAVSPKGAQGLMQLMPRTASALGVKDPFDPASNLDGGTRHLGSLMALYEGDLKKALAAYNAGAEAVKRHGGVPPYPETRAYVASVLKVYQAER